MLNFLKNKKGQASNAIIDLVIVIILIVAVAIPIVNNTITGANVTGITLTILNNIPVLIAVGGLVAAAALSR